ncbi:alpha/beta hydrolase family protein [Fulvivirga ligni]|uniref:alpha/beta hydrolase family protein n=1 Tax=Fulvivirga ligni TaxID=2904246 RepID=UPI001F227949|nr:alpha/beta fold hydrolase [Fulvivirga ligni]UII23343.1 alpha/beta fold hydrolase [Fulvivirga ligni]
MTNSIKLKDNILLSAKHNAAKILVDARYLSNNQKKPVIIFIHGFKGFKDWGYFNIMADNFADNGFVFLKLNLSHNGTTPENPSEFSDLKAFGQNNFTIELDDIDEVINYLFTEDCPLPASEMDLEKVFIMGHSRGGGVSILKAAEDSRIKGIVTWASVADFKMRWPEAALGQWKKDQTIYITNSRTKQEMPLDYQIVEDFFANEERFTISKAAENLTIPQLIVHGTNDETVEHREALMLHEMNPTSELFLIEDANHVLGGSHPYDSEILPEDAQKAFDKTLEFLKKATQPSSDHN